MVAISDVLSSGVSRPVEDRLGSAGAARLCRGAVGGRDCRSSSQPRQPSRALLRSLPRRPLGSSADSRRPATRSAGLSPVAAGPPAVSRTVRAS
jgi:hypothetical protein